MHSLDAVVGNSRDYPARCDEIVFVGLVFNRKEYFQCTNLLFCVIDKDVDSAISVAHKSQQICVTSLS